MNTPLDRESVHGVPRGRYLIAYYAVYRGIAFRRKYTESDASLGYVEYRTRQLDSHEVMVALCESQPGGKIAFGSTEAAEAWDRSEREAA